MTRLDASKIRGPVGPLVIAFGRIVGGQARGGRFEYNGRVVYVNLACQDTKDE